MFLCFAAQFLRVHQVGAEVGIARLITVINIQFNLRRNPVPGMYFHGGVRALSGLYRLGTGKLKAMSATSGTVKAATGRASPMVTAISWLSPAINATPPREYSAFSVVVIGNAFCGMAVPSRVTPACPRP